ncbi:dienelactone hydrolase family protein [Rheinheimera maricola]|uniref:Alpha/beta hydrolase family protein n=1 Tax=Rheinheimera maricola TaxID=2793282 RepID=A0ABS7X5W4_9GAMM|nr:alpha/beta hydrolase family protein [Rheinheimera maricola]MBZ9610535.1 alpha/beta hydrolase family protein [Rheinheimera maricola]
MRCCWLLLLFALPLQADKLIEQQLPDFYQQLLPQASYPLGWNKEKFVDIQHWRQQGRAALRAALLWPDEPVDFAAKLLETEQRDGYSAQLWSVQLTKQSRVQLMLLQPDTAKPAPAVLLLHDHGARFDIGKEKWIQPFATDERLPSAQQWAAKYFSGNFVGDALAKQGYLVLAADTFGWSDRGPIEFNAQQALAGNMFMLGRSLAGMAAYEDLRLVQYLKQLPQADSSRLAVLGFSMGAFRAWQLAALTDDIKAGVAIAWLNSYRHLITPGNNILKGQSAFYMLHPGLAAKLDIPDMAALAAPKAMLFINGGKDKLMPKGGVDYAYAQLATVWQAHGAPGKLTTTLYPNYGHEFNAEQQQQVFNWLAAQLATN